MTKAETEKSVKSADILRRSSHGLGAMFGVAFLSLLLTFAFPLSVAAIIDRVIVHNALSTLQIIAVVLIATSAFEGLVSILKGRILSFKTGEISARLSAVLIRKLFSVNPEHLLGNQGRRKVEMITTINLFRDSIRELIDFAIQVCLSVTIYAAVLIILNGQLFGFLMIALFAQIVFFAFSQRRLKPLVSESIKEYQQFSAMMHTSVNAIETVKIYGAGGIFRERAQEKVESALLKNFRAGKVTANGTAFSRLIMRVTEAAIITIGAFNVIAQNLTIGQLIAFQMFALRFFEPFGKLSIMMQRYQRVRTFFSDWDDFLAIEAGEKRLGKPPQIDPGAPILIVRDLSFVYEGSTHNALEDVSFTLDAGDVVFILGPSGSGKSTLVRLLSGLLPIFQGNVEVCGVRLEDVPESNRRRFVACALQEPMLLPGTVAENVSAFDENVSADDIRRALRLTGCESFVSRLPNGENSVVGETSASISGGERQRLCLARMCAGNAFLQIIDEGTSGLHRQLEVDVLEKIIAGMSERQATIVITHREDLAFLGNRILRFDEGKIVDQTRLEEKPAEYHAGS